MNEFRLRVGNAVLSLLFENPRESRALGRYFRRKSSREDADIQLSIRFRDTADERAEVPSSLFLTKQGGGDGFSMAGGLIEGRYSAAAGEGELAVERRITRGGYARIFEQVFYQAYWSAALKKGTDSFLLHSSGVVRKDRGWAFTGKSGSGKSTVARLSRRYSILNDEITVIDLSGREPAIRDTPFNGFYRGKTEGSAPLGGILLLKQASEHRITRVEDIESVKTLSRELIPPMGLETPFSTNVFLDMFDRANRARNRIPLYSMEFTPDGKFWDRIDEAKGA